MGRRAAFAASCWLGEHRPLWLDVDQEGSSFVTYPRLGKKKDDDLLYHVTVRNLRQHILDAGFRTAPRESVRQPARDPLPRASLVEPRAGPASRAGHLRDEHGIRPHGVMQFIITIDTEGDNQWDSALPPGTENIKFVSRFQELCDRYRFPPTYLCTYEVVDSAAFDDMLLPLPAAGRAEIGAHLHPWTNPPFSEWDRSETTYAYPSELPAPVFSKKLEALTALLTRKLGASPRSYRAGRWGLSAAHIPVLLELGYIVDCSVTPLLSWTDRGARERGQDFSAAPVTPYFMAWGDPGA